MQSTIKTELTTSEAKTVIAITEKEIQAIRHMTSSIHSQIEALETFMDSMGMQQHMWNSPRSIAAGEFKIKQQD
ncbi:MAG: hypothetical protein ACPHEP_06865 [Acidimicrobiales bacterium]